jgi:hypothetical protein
MLPEHHRATRHTNGEYRHPFLMDRNIGALPCHHIFVMTLRAPFGDEVAHEDGSRLVSGTGPINKCSREYPGISAQSVEAWKGNFCGVRRNLISSCPAARRALTSCKR